MDWKRSFAALGMNVCRGPNASTISRVLQDLPSKSPSIWRWTFDCVAPRTFRRQRGDASPAVEWISLSLLRRAAEGGHCGRQQHLDHMECCAALGGFPDQTIGIHRPCSRIGLLTLQPLHHVLRPVPPAPPAPYLPPASCPYLTIPECLKNASRVLQLVLHQISRILESFHASYKSMYSASCEHVAVAQAKLAILEFLKSASTGLTTNSNCFSTLSTVSSKIIEI